MVASGGQPTQGQRPQEPPQPSGPHCLPVQSGTQMSSHMPVVSLQVRPSAHTPQLHPATPPSPHSLLAQAVSQSGGSTTSGAQVWVASTQVKPSSQPPQSHSPITPHLPRQMGSQTGSTMVSSPGVVLSSPPEVSSPGVVVSSPLSSPPLSQPMAARPRTRSMLVRMVASLIIPTSVKPKKTT